MPHSEFEEYDEEELEAAYAAENSSGAGGRSYEYADNDDLELSDDRELDDDRDLVERRDAADRHEVDGDHDDYLDEDEEHYADDSEAVSARARAYRPGRGGFDPEIAELTARAKYSFRQRIVVAMLLAAVITGFAAGLTMPMLWWAHGAIDLSLVGYLTYLRRQVRIEENIRQRRMARLANSRPRPAPRVHTRPAELAEPARPVARIAPAPVHHPGATRVELDDEDPVFDELDEPAPVNYRRAVGE